MKPMSFRELKCYNCYTSVFNGKIGLESATPRNALKCKKTAQNQRCNGCNTLHRGKAQPIPFFSSGTETQNRNWTLDNAKTTGKTVYVQH